MNIKILMLGDLIGNTGQQLFARHINTIKKNYSIDCVIVNGENSAESGKGITPKGVEFLLTHGADAITSGNHIWDKKETSGYFQQNPTALLTRPANYPSSCPGKGIIFVPCKGSLIAVVNLMGRAFMRQHLDCPFKTADSLLTFIHSKTSLVFVDMHAETTAEKLALVYYLEGRVTAVVGTHTHIQTADERILPGGTAYISDLGMGGSFNSMIGFKKEGPIHNFITQMPARYEVDTEPPYALTGLIVTADTQTGKALHVERLNVIDTNPIF